MKKAFHFYETSEIYSKDVVLSVPSYFTNVERQAVLDACEIANLKCTRLINESTAICLNYGFFRKKDLPEKKEEPRHVVFVDFGHTKLTVTIANFVKGKCKILCHHSDRNCGARNIDYQIAEKLGENFNKKYGCDPRKNVRSRIRMLDAIEKQRKVLSGITEVTIHIESLLEDEDLHENLKRSEMEEMVAPMLEKIQTVMAEALEKSGKNYFIYFLFLCFANLVRSLSFNGR